jgi:hypothetical protein
MRPSEREGRLLLFFDSSRDPDIFALAVFEGRVN